MQLFSDKKVDQKRENKFLNFLMAAFCAARLITYKDAFTGNFPESNNLYGLDPTCGRICRSAQFVEACVAAPLWVSVVSLAACVANPKPYINATAWFQRCIFMAKHFPTFLIWYSLRLFLPIAELCDYNQIFFLEFFPFV